MIANLKTLAKHNRLTGPAWKMASHPTCRFRLRHRASRCCKTLPNLNC